MSFTRDISTTDARDRQLIDDLTLTRRRPAHLEISQMLRRGVAVIGLAGIALVHVVDATSKFHETPYLGWAYVALIVSCLAIAGMLIERDDRRTWVAAAAVSCLAFVAFALSRTTGLPSAKGDIGNWFEPLGLATIFAEAIVAAVALRAVSVTVVHSSSRR